MSAAELGQMLLQWGAAGWNQGLVTVQRVRESKKNKGRKRVLWQRGVKAYWAGRGKGSGKGKEEDKEAVAYPDAPGRKSPAEEANAYAAKWWPGFGEPVDEKENDEKEEEEEEEEEDCKVIEPLVKHHKGPEHDPEGGSGGGSSLFAVFGP